MLVQENNYITCRQYKKYMTGQQLGETKFLYKKYSPKLNSLKIKR